MILITGATGQLGGAVIGQLLQQTAASQLAALVRDSGKAAHLVEKGVTIRVGTYDDTDSLDKAMQGVEKVLLIAGGEADNALQQHQHVVDAAKKAGVRYIAYTSRSLRDRNSLANPLMERHFQTEDYIKASGLNYVLVRNSLYMDTIPLFVGPTVLDSGIFLPAGEGNVAFALRRELGEAIANVLLQPNWANQVYHFTGANAYSFADVASVLTQLSGKPVNYTPVGSSEFGAQLKQRGVPEPAIQTIIDFMTDVKNGQEETVSADLETSLGRKPASLREGLKSFYHL